MSDAEAILKFAEKLILEKTDTYCSELQRRILKAALQQERVTYDQLAKECGYSSSYVKQDVAPKLWQLISEVLEQKVTKSNARLTLAGAMDRTLSSQTQPPDQPDPSANPMPEVSIATASPPLETNSISQIQILLVDDRPQNLRLLTDLLEQQGYKVLQAINGAVALQTVTTVHPDLILLDIQMPDMDGYTVCQRLKADSSTRDIPVIFVSAMDETWDKVKAFSVGGSDYISKPFKVVEVLARVEQHIKMQRLQRLLEAKNARLQHALQELQRLAFVDELTGVASRRRLDAYLLECWRHAEQSRSAITLMLCHMDRFSAYSEGGSPDMGDRRLTQIAELIEQTVKGPNDLVGRYGTLTFAIVLPQQAASEVEQIAHTLLQQVNNLKIPRELPSLSLSIGMTTTLPTPDAGLEKFLEGCESNLQQAKNKGGDCLVGTRK